MAPDRNPVGRIAGQTQEDPQPAEQLKYIRDVMERTSTFTAVPGWGAIGMGICALIGAGIGEGMDKTVSWLTTWLVVAIVAASLGAGTLILKSRKADSPLLSGAGRKFLASFVPPLLVGIVLTFALWEYAVPKLFAGTWMLMYGTAIISGGAFSVRPIPLMGVLFLILGSITLFLPYTLHNTMMAISFGLLHIVFGALIAKNHGG